MFADAIKCTHNGTGGASTLTLAAVTGYPQPTDAFGSSGVALIRYQIAEYTDATHAVLSKYEAGIGSLALSTNVLTRARIDVTWGSGSYNMVTAAALTFGATAANIVITLGGSARTQKGGLSSTFSLGSTPDLWQPFGTRTTYDGSLGTFTMTNGLRLYIPIEYVYTKPITQVAVEVTTLAATSNLRMGLYDADPSTGGPLNLLREFTSATQIATTATGYQAVTMGAAFWTPPGFYWLCMQADNSTVQIRRLSHLGSSGIGTSNTNGRDVLMFDKSATYGALPAIADTTVSNLYSRSAGGQTMGFFK